MIKTFATKGPITRLDVTTMPQEFTRKFDVTLNGVKQRHCIVADENEGYVVRYRMGLFGGARHGSKRCFQDSYSIWRRDYR